MTMIRDQVAEEVRALLARRRLSARAAARQLGWTANYLSRRMTGEIAFDVEDLDALGRLLNVQVTAFFSFLEHDSSMEGRTLPVGMTKRYLSTPGEGWSLAA